MQILLELQRSQVSQRAVGPVPVVVGAPVLDHHPGVGQVLKPIQVQALISELAIETLDVPVLRRFARCVGLPGVSVCPV